MRLAIGWTLVHSLWEGAIIAVALGAVLLATRSPRIRYAAACLSMLALLGGSSARSVTSTDPAMISERPGGDGAGSGPFAGEKRIVTLDQARSRGAR